MFDPYFGLDQLCWASFQRSPLRRNRFLIAERIPFLGVWGSISVDVDTFTRSRLPLRMKHASLLRSVGMSACIAFVAGKTAKDIKTAISPFEKLQPKALSWQRYTAYFLKKGSPDWESMFSRTITRIELSFSSTLTSFTAPAQTSTWRKICFFRPRPNQQNFRVFFLKTPPVNLINQII